MAEGADFAAAFYGPIYSALGVDATLAIGTDAYPGLRVIDKTAGEPVNQTGSSNTMLGGINMPVLKPAAMLRMTELTDNGLTAPDVVGAAITFNGASWDVLNYEYRPSRYGRLYGELLLVLEAQDGTDDD